MTRQEERLCVTIEEYESGGAAGWRGCIRDDAGKWIVWVGLDGSASLFKLADGNCEPVGHVPERPAE